MLSLPNNFVAMETRPIPNLSVQSKPGIKVIISGPIQIFVGVLMLDPSNTTVLGGCIPDLMPIQQKALSCAAQVAGVGIDPTFRALVWNPDTGMENGKFDVNFSLYHESLYKFDISFFYFIFIMNL